MPMSRVEAARSSRLDATSPGLLPFPRRLPSSPDACSPDGSRDDTTMDGFEGRAYACLIAGLIGDAMGTPTENLEPDEIERRFGWVSTCTGPGTDDSLM